MSCEYRQLGDVAIQFIDGDRGKNYPSNNEFSNVGYCLFLNAKNVTPDGFSFGEVSFITQKKDAMLRKGKLEKNDVVLTTRGTVGNVAFYGARVLYSNVRINSGMLIIRPDPSVFCPEYVYWLFRSDVIQDQIKRFRSGTAQPQLPISSIKKFEIPLVDIKTQKKIAVILSALDEKIAINREINENLERQAASIFAGWLNTCTDFSTIGDMAHNILDYSPVASEQIRLLNSSDVTEGVFPVVPLVPNKDLKGHFKKRFKFGDILYSEIRPRNHHYGFVLFDASDYIASTRLMVIRAIENKVSPAMLYQYLLLPEVEAEFTLKTESRSGTFPQGNYADMASIQVPYSPTNSQTAVSEILSRIRFAIAQNQFESQRLAELRDALLPKLMSGEIDVSAVQL